MTDVKRFIRKSGRALFLFAFAAALFTCKEVPEYCGKGAVYDPKTEGCLEKGSDAVGQRCPDGSIIPFKDTCPVVKPPTDSTKPPVDTTKPPPADTTKQKFTATVSSAGAGASGGGSYAKGDTVRITAGTPPSGQQFKNWTSTDGVVFTDANKNATTFIMPAKAVTVTAAFEKTPVVPPPGADSGTFTDSDGKKYKTVKIGGLTWMAENYNREPLDGSWCYKNSADSCEKYGRLYDWETARVVCTNGWVLPSRQNWDTLTAYAGGEFEAGKKLKSATGWKSQSGIAATNELGFSALPGGYRAEGDKDLFLNAGERGYWWTRTQSERNNDKAYGWVMTHDYDGANRNEDEKKSARSVRCVKSD